MLHTRRWTVSFYVTYSFYLHDLFIYLIISMLLGLLPLVLTQTEHHLSFQKNPSLHVLRESRFVVPHLVH